MTSSNEEKSEVACRLEGRALLGRGMRWRVIVNVDYDIMLHFPWQERKMVGAWLGQTNLYTGSLEARV